MQMKCLKILPVFFTVSLKFSGFKKEFSIHRCICLLLFLSPFIRIFDHTRFWDTPVVKSSSRELCYIILAGICLGYLCTFSLIAKPHIVYCYLQRLGIGLSPAMSYSALVTKVLLASTENNPGA